VPGDERRRGRRLVVGSNMPAAGLGRGETA
jgi:hypothetical protein